MRVLPPSLHLLTLWATDAGTVFVNGCMGGITVGGASGAGMGGATATTLGDHLAASDKITASLGAVVLGVMANGVKDFVIWHHAHPMPNPFRLPPNETPTTPTPQP